MAQKSAAPAWVRAPNLRSRNRSGPATHGGERCYRQRQQCRDDGARALRAVFSSHDNWPHLSEAERDEWRGYFNRMVGWLRQFGYTPERNPCSMLLEGSTAAIESSNEKRPDAQGIPTNMPDGFPARGCCTVGDVTMLEFRVVCYEAGAWDQANARVVEAQDEKAAAERVCGGPLTARDKIGQLRAQVSPVSKPAAKTLFYVAA
jgi:hypothetical protein